MLIAIFGYRQVTCRETSTNSSRPKEHEPLNCLLSRGEYLAVFKIARTRAKSSILKYKYEQKR